MNKEQNGKKFLYQLVKKFKFRIILLFIVATALGLASTIKVTSLQNLVDNFSITSMIFFILSVIILEVIWNVMKLSDIYIYPLLKQHVMQQFFTRILNYEDYYFQKNSSTKILNAMRNVVDVIEDYIETIRDLISTFALVVASFVIFYFVHPIFFAFGLVWLCFLSIFFYIGGTKGSKYSKDVFQNNEKIASMFGDILNNIIIVKTFNGIKHEECNFDKATKESTSQEQSKAKMFIIISFAEMGLYLSFLGIFLYIIYQMRVNFMVYDIAQISIGQMGTVLDRFQIMYYFLNELAVKFADMVEYHASIINGLNLLYEEIEEKKYIESGDLKFKKGEMVFDNLKFKYADSNEYDFQINGKIKIPAGSTVAIVGPSGGGKTTFLKLILRLLEPESGNITIDGQNIYTHSLSSIRDTITFIPQSIGLFDRTIGENIDYGFFENDLKKIKDASEKAKIDQDIESMIKKYDTIIGEDKALSGGQKQRVMIARSLLKNAKIYLFDESTSALDVQIEMEILQNINEFTKGYTKFIIAHRLNTIKSADIILVCEQGSIVESGTHKELIDLKGLYYNMINV